MWYHALMDTLFSEIEQQARSSVTPLAVRMRPRTLDELVGQDEAVSAIGGTVSDLRREIDAAEKRLAMNGSRTILFVDEIHRFNRSQQDSLLHAVEDRVIVLVGATTENPFFEVNSALISRSRVVELHSLSDADIMRLIEHALSDERGLGGRYRLTDEARAAIVLLAGGDGRAALTTLELAAGMVEEGTPEKVFASDNERMKSFLGRYGEIL